MNDFYHFEDQIDDLLFEKSVVFGHKKIYTLVGYLVNFWGVDHKMRFFTTNFFRLIKRLPILIRNYRVTNLHFYLHLYRVR